MATQERKARHWVLLAQHYETDQDFRVAVEQALVDIYALSYWGGRGVMTAPIRRKDPETDTYVTIGFAFEEVFMPAVRDPEPANEPPTPIPPPPAEWTLEDCTTVLRDKYAGGEITLEQLEALTDVVLEAKEPAEPVEV